MDTKYNEWYEKHKNEKWAALSTPSHMERMSVPYLAGFNQARDDSAARIAAQAARIAELEAALDMCRGLAHGIAAATSGTLYHDAQAIAQTVDAAMLKKG